MARSRLTLVVVLVFAVSSFVATIQERTVSSPLTSRESNEESTSLLCVTLVKAETQITLGVQDSLGRWNVTVKLEDCSPMDTDLLAVKVVKSGFRMFRLKMRLGDCVMNCLEVRPHDATLSDITAYSSESVICRGAHLWPFRVEVNATDDSCTSAKLHRHTNQRGNTLITDSPHTSTEPFVAPGEAPKPTALPAPAAALLATLVVEVVATCVMCGVVVVVIRGARNTVISPATTNVRRLSLQDEMYTCENDMYEPFSGSTAADQGK